MNFFKPVAQRDGSPSLQTSISTEPAYTVMTEPTYTTKLVNAVSAVKFG